jgi:hypothetical protein
MKDFLRVFFMPCTCWTGCLFIKRCCFNYLGFYRVESNFNKWIEVLREFLSTCTHEGVSKSFRTGRLERELQMVQLSATKCSCNAILWISLVSFVAITLCSLWLSPETFGYTLVCMGNGCLGWDSNPRNPQVKQRCKVESK